MKERGIGMFVFLVVLGLLLATPGVVASIDGINISMKVNYSGGESIKGKVELKITNDLPALNITSNFPGSLSLLDWLRRNALVEGTDYRCTTKNCTIAMSAQTDLPAPLSLSSETKVVGFNLSGDDLQIQSLRLGIQSDAASSCSAQVSVDVIDGNVSLLNGKYVNTLCDVKQRGCYSNAAKQVVAEISSNQQNPYCEKITLPAGPAYHLSAIVTNSTKAYAELTLSLYDINWNAIDSCVLPKHAQHTEELNCVINVSRSASQSSLLCISAKAGIVSNYSIATETSSPVCGTSQRGSSSFNRDYPLSAQPLTFAQPSFEINEYSVSQLTGKSLVNLLNTYLNKVYGNNCTNGCALPFVIHSATNQQISFSTAELKYTSLGALLTNTHLYTLESVQPTISADRVNLSLDSLNFSIPRGTKESTFVLFAGGTRIFSPVTLSIQSGFDFEVYPDVATLGLPTLFNIGGNDNITQSVWKFGDGNVDTIKGKALYHIYKDAGNFILEVTATKNGGTVSTKKFSVKVGDANVSAKILLPYATQRLANLSAQLAQLPSWKSQILEKKLNITSLKVSLDTLQKQYTAATSDDNYTVIVKGILQLNIPSDVLPTTTNEDTLLIGIPNANLRYLAVLSEVDMEKVSNEESIKRALADWTDRSYKADVKREVYSSLNGGKVTELATFFTVSITKVAENATPAFFILDAPLSAVSFDGSYQQQEITAGSSKGTVIPISGDKVFSFVLPESADIASLGVYLAPNLNDLTSEQVKAEPFNFYSPWRSARNGIILTILGFFIVYLFLQGWYKRHYESHLFRTGDDLYNIVNFIYNARSQHLGDGDIRKKLVFTGWSGEQVTYAFKKIDGKRTGMLEIPIFKFLENRKVRKEIEKRQQEAVDARFIKRPSF